MEEISPEKENEIIEENVEAKHPEVANTIVTFDNNAHNYSDTSIKNHNFTNNLIRKEFCRSVYFLLAIQTFFAGTIAFINAWVNNYYTHALSLCLVCLEGISILSMNISSRSCFECRLYFPINYIILIIYTFLEGCFIGSLVFLTQVRAVKYTYKLSMVVYLQCSQIIWCTYGVSSIMLILSVLTEAKKLDITRWYGVAVILVFLTSVCTVYSCVETSLFLYYLHCCIGMLPFPVWVLFDTQLIMTRKRRQIDVKDYCYAVLQVYIDITDLLCNIILNLFLYIRKLCNTSNGMS